ncbi:MAG: hypothetical protein ACJKSS_01655 [Patescibacteria group bacterium UBA2103]
MISKPTNILSYAKAHPIKSGLLAVFTFFTILGTGFGTLYVVAPDTAEAVLVGNPCCTTGWDPWGPGGWNPEPVIDPGFPGGGGGGGTVPAPVCSLTVNPTSIVEGDSATLTWVTRYADLLAIDNSIGNLSEITGSVSVSPTETTTYTLVAQNSYTGRTVECNATVTVTEPPVVPVCTLNVNPSAIERGGSATISWTTTNGSTFRIGGIGDLTPVSGGSTEVTPVAAGTYTYVGVVTSADGSTATCEDTLTVTPPIVVNPPVCTLDIVQDTITIGEKINIDWETRHANTFSIDNGVGDINLWTDPIASGSVSTTPGSEGTITYTGTATNTDGDTVECSDTVTVLPIGIDTPACTLTADKFSLLPGETTTIRWTLINVTEATLQHLDAVQIIDPTDGSQSAVAGTYTLRAGNGLASVECEVTIVRVTVDAPACTLTADKLSLLPGETTTINWTIENATEATLQHLDAVQIIDPTDGSQSAVAGTYTLSVGNGTLSETCEVTIVRITPGTLSCDLNIDRAIIRSGETAEISWTTNEAVSFEINGEDKPLNGSETIQPLGVQIHTYTGIATDADGNTVECEDTVQVTGGSGGGGLSCAMSFDRSAIRAGQSATLRWEVRNADVNTIEINQGIGNVAPLASEEVRRSDTGTHEYVLTARGDGDQVTCRATLTVSGGSGCSGNCGGGSTPQISIDFLKTPGEQALAFVTLSQIPYTGLELGPVGAVIYWVFLIVWSGAVAYLVLFKALPFARRKLVMVGEDVMEVLDASKEDTMYASMPEEKEHVEFLPNQKGDDALSVEDIVRGLSRMHKEKAPEENVLDEIDVAAEMELPPVEKVAPVTSGEDMRLLNAIISGDKDASFGILRRVIRNGARAEDLFEKVLVHLDSAYRARVDGAYVDEDVRRATASLDTALLEEVITALAPAIDTTYSHAQTGAKLALTRVHQVIARG